MLMADWIALGSVLLFALIGAGVGFGRGIRFFTGGIFGFIISLVACYFLFGIVLGWPFVQDLVAKLDGAIRGNGDNNVCVWLVDTLKISNVIIAVGLFIIIQILRVIILNIFRRILEAPNFVCRTVNKVFGVVLFLLVLAIAALIAAQIVEWVGGDTASQLTDALNRSVFRLDWLYAHNPLKSIIDGFSSAAS